MKGHQKKPKEEFDLWEWTNDDCDRDTGVFHKACEQQDRPNISFPSHKNHGLFGMDPTRSPVRSNLTFMMEFTSHQQIGCGHPQDET
jgi:hypothetical protein